MRLKLTCVSSSVTIQLVREYNVNSYPGFRICYNKGGTHYFQQNTDHSVFFFFTRKSSFYLTIFLFFSLPTDEGVYNTYVLDCADTWAVLLHCAEKPSSPRYLSSILLSRDMTVPANVRSYVRDKLPKYGVQLEYTFAMVQDRCSPAVRPLYYGTAANANKKLTVNNNKHPMLHNGRQKTEIETNSS